MHFEDFLFINSDSIEIDVFLVIHNKITCGMLLFSFLNRTKFRKWMNSMKWIKESESTRPFNGSLPFVVIFKRNCQHLRFGNFGIILSVWKEKKFPFSMREIDTNASTDTDTNTNTPIHPYSPSSLWRVQKKRFNEPLTNRQIVRRAITAKNYRFLPFSLCIFPPKNLPLFATVIHRLAFALCLSRAEHTNTFHSHPSPMKNETKHERKKIVKWCICTLSIADTRSARWNVWPIKCFSWTHFTIPILLFYLNIIFIIVDFIPCHFFLALFFSFVLPFLCVCSRSHTRVCTRAIPFYLLTHYMRSFFYLLIWKIPTHTPTDTHNGHSGERESNPCFIGIYKHHKNIYNMRL